jgi:hypothetical protein
MIKKVTAIVILLYFVHYIYQMEEYFLQKHQKQNDDQLDYHNQIAVEH